MNPKFVQRFAQVVILFSALYCQSGGILTSSRATAAARCTGTSWHLLGQRGMTNHPGYIHTLPEMPIKYSHQLRRMFLGPWVLAFTLCRLGKSVTHSSSHVPPPSFLAPVRVDEKSCKSKPLCVISDQKSLLFFSPLHHQAGTISTDLCISCPQFHCKLATSSPK